MRLVVAVLVCCMASVGVAADGRIEINQSTIDEAGGPPVVLDQAGMSYVLTGPINVQDGTAIQITANNIALDLNGFTITGPGQCTGTPPSCTNATANGISGFGAEGVTVHGGTIVGMGGSVTLGSSARIYGLTIRNCRDGINVVGAGTSGALIHDNITENVELAGFAIGAIVRNNVFRNIGFEFSLDANSSYMNNLVVDGPSGSSGIGGGKALGPNLCDGQTCGRVPERRYYLTKESFAGDQAIGACESGFHMASFAEIFDPSNLMYDTRLGQNSDDSGQGPPFAVRGFVRTGRPDSSGSSVAGEDNCNSWTLADDLGIGSDVALVADWRRIAFGADPWDASDGLCFPRPVWCVED